LFSAEAAICVAFVPISTGFKQFADSVIVVEATGDRENDSAASGFSFAAVKSPMLITVLKCRIESVIFPKTK